MTWGSTSLLEVIRPHLHQSCTDWCCENIDLSLDPSASRDVGKFDITYRPHMREPLDFFSRPGGGKMTVVGIEQLGKSSVWKLGLIFRSTMYPEPALIVYPSEELGVEENTESLEPLMRGVPQLAKLLALPFSHTKDAYRLGRALIHFTGSGSPVISKRAALAIGDEVNSWVTHDGKASNVLRLDHRGRSFQDPRRVLVCSPTGSGGTIWQEFRESSKGYWTLQCQGCEELTLRSCDIAGRWVDGQRRGGLQFEVKQDDDEVKTVVESSIRLVCPECGQEHRESQSYAMNNGGGYVHENPRLIPLHAGYQFGALSNIPSLFPKLSWTEIANAQLRAGSSGTLEAQMDFANSWRGLPFRTKRKVEEGEGEADMQLRLHIGETPANSDFLFRVMAVDTQDDCFYYVIRGYTATGDSHRLGYGHLETFEDVVRMFGSPVCGAAPLLGIQDVQGHREKEVGPLVKRVHGLFLYKGTGVIRDRHRYLKWKRQGKGKLIYAAARMYQAELLYKIHRQLDRTKPYWYLPPEIGNDYAPQILALQPNARKKDGDQYENWESVSKDDHYFDCEKMCLLAAELAVLYSGTARRSGKSPQELINRDTSETVLGTVARRKQKIHNY